MKGSLMKPPVVADIYDHKMYHRLHSALTKIICVSWNVYATSEGVSCRISKATVSI